MAYHDAHHVGRFRPFIGQSHLRPQQMQYWIPSFAPASDVCGLCCIAVIPENQIDWFGFGASHGFGWIGLPIHVINRQSNATDIKDL